VRTGSLAPPIRNITYSGPAQGFIEVAREMLSAIARTQHLLANILIELRDDTSADCESYFQAYHLIEDDNGGSHDLVVAGRYVDRFEKRDDEWRIAQRSIIVDWFRQYPDTCEFGDNKPLGIANARPGHELAARKPHDRSYTLMA
jgi:SnoaL-like domain